MSRRKINAGSQNVMLPIFVQDNTSTTGAGLGSLVFNTSGLAAKYRRAGDSSWSTITLATATVGTFASGGFVADGGPVIGGYEVGIPNAVLASGATWAQVEYYGAANMLPVLIEFELDAVNYQDAVHFGLSSLPNAAANANGGLPILSSGATTLAYTVSTATTLTNLPAITTNWLTGTGIDSTAVSKLGGGVWDVTLVSHLTSGTTGNALNAAGSAGDPWATSLPGAYGAGSAGHLLGTDVPTSTAAIKAKTDNLPSDPASASTLASEFTALQNHGDSTWSTITALGIRTAVGLATANIDAQFTNVPTGILDFPNAIENGLTLRGATRLYVAANAGKVIGADTTTVTIRNVGDTKNRIVATVDASGNRSAVTTDAS